MKRTSYKIKEKILICVKEKKASYATLERKINTGFRTIKTNCEELKNFGHIKIEEIKHPSNGKPAHSVSITKQGIDFLKNIKKKK